MEWHSKKRFSFFISSPFCWLECRYDIWNHSSCFGLWGKLMQTLMSFSIHCYWDFLCSLFYSSLILPPPQAARSCEDPTDFKQRNKVLDTNYCRKLFAHDLKELEKWRAWRRNIPMKAWNKVDQQKWRQGAIIPLRHPQSVNNTCIFTPGNFVFSLELSTPVLVQAVDVLSNT